MELTMNGITKKFGDTLAVNNLTLTFRKGVYGLLGANGAGKTTLMKIICNIQNPTGGRVSYNGKEISKLNEEYRNILGYLPQKFCYYPNFSAYEFLMYVAALKGLNKAMAKKRSSELLKIVGLFEVRKKKIKTFSGGMKRRLGIAQAMINDPKILILDEPTAGLDPKERVKFRNFISTLSKDRIVLLSTHIVADVEFIAEEIVIIKSGQLLHKGKPEIITSSIDGYVWESKVKSNKTDEYLKKFIISNLKNISEDETLFRIISKTKPLANAIKVPPNLEDLYLFYFNEEGKEND